MTDLISPEASGFADFAPAVRTPTTQDTDAGSVALAESSKRDIEAAMMLALAHPRSELDAVQRIRKACARPTLAGRAVYSFPRGGQRVTGPSVVLARELGRCWGNIRWGTEILPSADDVVHLKCYALDLESNARVEAQDRFRKRIQRRTKRRDADGKPMTEWVEPDERDLRELVNRRAAFGVRNCLLELIPADVIEDALEACRQTAVKAANGDLQLRREDVLRNLVIAFEEWGVSRAMMEKRIGNGLDEISPEQLADLRATYKALRDRQVTREEAFPHDGPGAASDVSSESTAAQKAKAAIANAGTPKAEPATTDPGRPPTKKALAVLVTGLRKHGVADTELLERYGPADEMTAEKYADATAWLAKLEEAAKGAPDGPADSLPGMDAEPATADYD